MFVKKTLKLVKPCPNISKIGIIMIGIIRVKFPAKPISQVWNDNSFHNLMDTNIEYSLGKY